MKFDKEYISEADCPEIQGLRKWLELGDWIAYKPDNKEICLITRDNSMDDYFSEVDRNLRDDRIWLPTGDQLDDEIIKVCKEKDYYNYSWLWHQNSLFVVTYEDRNGDNYPFRDRNSLIAKIKLLKELLNG